MPTLFVHRVAANNLLASLPAVVLERILPHLALVSLAAGETLYDSNLPHREVYFPVGARVALSYMGNGVPAVVSYVGNDGVIGIPLFLSGSISPCRAVVSTAGAAYCISASRLTGEFNRPGPALRQFLDYSRRLTEQMTQSANCGVEEIIDKKRCGQCGYAKACPHAG